MIFAPIYLLTLSYMVGRGPATPVLVSNLVQVSVLLKREEELATALEEEAASRQRERREQHHTNRQVTALGKQCLECRGTRRLIYPEE